MIRAAAIVAALAGAAAAQDDPYLAYVKGATEFRRVRQDPALVCARWDTWVYMPWRYQWTIGTNDESGRFCKEYGINGGFSDYGEGPLLWLERNDLRFYNDHTAGKGALYLRGANSKSNFRGAQRDPRRLRFGSDGPQLLDAATLARLQETIWKNIHWVRKSPLCLAYALDDEISWGAFVLPLPWRLHEDDEDYARWLRRCYGSDPPRPQYVTPEFTRAQLGGTLKSLDFSPLLDRITYNDSYWANFVGALVEECNQADGDTPCGFVGGQPPNLWGGYDYAKLMKKVQFIEAYDVGSAAAIIRSFNPDDALPVVLTHFHDEGAGVGRDAWLAWYYFAHGQRGMIGWVEGWFDGERPRPWLGEFKRTLKELGGAQGPKMRGARWIHDGVAIYYSHPSIQVSWCLDAEPHGDTWPNRGDDDRHGTSHNVRKAWEHLLQDSGLQYDFIAYDEVVVNGVPEEYHTLVLPCCFALSVIEARRVREFCERGGTVIADFMCGLFDQHGRGRGEGALDSLFGVRHDGSETKKDFFSGKLWVEADQDAGYGFKSYGQLFDTLRCGLHEGFAVAEKRLPVKTARDAGKGKAVYLNLSPQRYLQYREEGKTTAAHSALFLEHVPARARVTPLAGGERARDLETTYWSKDGRTLLFVVQNPGPAGKLRRESFRIELAFARPAKDLVNERTGEALGDGDRFAFDFPACEALFLSYRDG
ncbi:MAG: beta-galactosidase trimerization domain-containing protein [Planctomycetota bacterium]